MSLEGIERRVLAGLRCVSSVDGQPVGGPLEVTAVAEDTGALTAYRVPLRVMANRRGILVVHAAPPLPGYESQFEPPEPPPDPVELRLRVEDRSGRYLPGVFRVTLPRSLDSSPVGSGYATDSVFEPLALQLMPGPSAPVADSWAVLRVHLFQEIPDDPPGGSFRTVPVPGALIRVFADEPAPRRLLSRGLTEWRRWPGSPPATVAEALVAVAGIPAAAWSNQPGGAVLTQNQAVRLEVRVDSAADLSRADAVPDLERLEPVAPAPLPAEVTVAELNAAVALRTGLRETVRLLLDRNGDLTRI